MKLDTFKQRTLDQLARMQEEPNTYPIKLSDLIYVDRCALCGSQNITRLTEVYLPSNLNFCATSVCNDCVYTFRAISPSLSWFKKCWKTISTKELKVFNPEVEEIRQRRYGEYYDLLSRYAFGGRFLDVGAAYGTGTKLFQDYGYEVEALEPEDDKANYIQQFYGIPVHSGPIEEFQGYGAYDLIVFAHCLEHLDQPTEAIARVKNLVNPVNGILYVEVPILSNFVTWSDAFYLTHKSNFSEDNLFGLLARAGLESLETVWYQHTPDEPWDLGVVARPARERLVPRVGDRCTVEDVQALYRKGLPLNSIPPIGQVLRYQVPDIEQFYCTLRFDTWRIVEPSTTCEFIGFESK